MKHIFLMAIAFATLCLSNNPVREMSRQKNNNQNSVLMIIVDDWSQYEIEENNLVMPNLDSFISQGAMFTDMNSHPTCSPTRLSMNFGLMVTRTLGNACQGILPDRTLTVDELTRPTLPRIFTQIGYKTSIHGKLHFGTTFFHTQSDDFKYIAKLIGYNTVRSGISTNIRNDCVANNLDHFRWQEINDDVVAITNEYATSKIVNSVITRKSEIGNDPFFIVASLNDAHGPFYNPPVNWLPPGYVIPSPPSLRDNYEAMMGAADTAIGILVNNIDLEKTLVIIMGDNGTPSDTVAPGHLVSHSKRTLFEDAINVPFIMLGAGIPEGITINDTVSVSDIMATLADYVNQDVKTHGESFLPTLNGSRFTRSYVHVMTAGGDRAIKTQRYKLMRFVEDGSEVLYDLELDPDELMPLDPNDFPGVTPKLHSYFDEVDAL
jgi:arylsulfatase A-like enzyme